MNAQLDEAEVSHLYACLQVGGEKFSKLKKDSEKLNREDPSIDAEIELNAKLRRVFNPRAEEEARAASRNNDAQMDLTDVPSSGETGGGIPAGQTFSLNTGEPKSTAELRDGLFECGVAVLLDDIAAWSSEEQRAASEYIDGMRQATAEGIPFGPSDPECVERDGTTVSRLQELLAMGPYRVEEVPAEELGCEFEVCRDSADDSESIDVDSTETLKLDAEIRAARLNRTELQRADMSDDEVIEWAGKGPWMVTTDEPMEKYWITVATQHEDCESHLDAMGRAARYNRSIAQRAGEPVEPVYDVVAEGRAD